MISFYLAAALSIFTYVNDPVLVMREEPNSQSEVASDAFFSEPLEILEEAGEWIKVKNPLDNYQGWIKKGSGIIQRQTPYASDSSSQVAKINRCRAHLYAVQDTIYGPLLTLPFESQLEVLPKQIDSSSRWIPVRLPCGREAYVQNGDVKLSSHLLDRQEMVTLSRRFLDLPYTWGGRTSFGYDCSGFVQMLYRQMGIKLPRHSGDQCKWEGLEDISFDQLIPGDLIFFGLAEDKVRHVGMYIGDDQFIHATVAENAPFIHISNLNDPEWKGIGRFAYRAAKTLKN